MITQYFNWYYGMTTISAQAKLWEIIIRMKATGWVVYSQPKEEYTKYGRAYIYECSKFSNYKRIEIFLILTITNNVKLLAKRNNYIANISLPPFRKSHLEDWDIELKATHINFINYMR